MGKPTGLAEFIRSKAASKRHVEAAIDWDGRKNAWLQNIEHLYALVRKWLGPLEKEEVVRLHTTEVPLEEDPIGPYTVGVLHILIGKQKVSFYPKGTLIVGAEGRIDIRGPRAVRSIVLKDGEWRLVESMPHLKLLFFNQKSFREILREVTE